MSVSTAYLGLGANVGDREENLRRALRLLAGQMSMGAVSSLYETAPWGYLEQPPFLNMACAVETALAPLDLLALTQEVERLVGRTPTFRFGPRVMDVDILLYGNQQLETGGLTIPHPGLATRAFALAPLAEIAPQQLHPGLGKTVLEMLSTVPGMETIARLGRLAL